ncbi:hypothetical protein SH668x_000309 [Planctomicrobium sp. SH668]|uniref:hypothetical protein n=1 Tax=Planctomicrobium sp. SH668 TaxID=3448126 RepID=UPI003F5B4A93
MSVVSHRTPIAFMKFNGKTLTQSITVQFALSRGNGDPLLVTLKPLPLGFNERLRTRGIAPPVPPTKIARDSGAKPIRDPNGIAITMLDKLDPAFVEAMERYHRCVAVLSVVESLRGDSQLTFDSEPPTSNRGEDWIRFADSLHEEMVDGGFTAGDLIRLFKEVCRLSNLLDEHVAVARGNFSDSTEGTTG